MIPMQVVERAAALDRDAQAAEGELREEVQLSRSEADNSRTYQWLAFDNNLDEPKLIAQYLGPTIVVVSLFFPPLVGERIDTLEHMFVNGLQYLNHLLHRHVSG